jgi:UDP-N-acetylglucosamine transferase subunit ALG13
MAGTVSPWRPRILGGRSVILVTIGSLFPFDRLIRAVDELAPSWPNEEFFAQIGDGEYEPTNMRFSRMLSAKAFAEAVKSARLIIAHAGMGSVITAMEANKPIVILPRKMEFDEHTTDHQMATARWLIGRRGVYVALADENLRDVIDEALSIDMSSEGQLPSSAPIEFLTKIKDYIERI